MAIIKKLWFVRNTYKLIQQLAVAVSGFSAFYTAICIWALSNGDYSRFFERFGSLLILPIISVTFTLLSYRLYLRLQKQMEKTKMANKQGVYADIMTGWSLATPLALFFWQLHLLNELKQVQGFGLAPTYICIAAGVAYTIHIVVKSRKLA